MKPDDHLANMIEAVATLRHAVLNMGPGFRVVSIEIDDGVGGYSFDACIRSSPSYVSLISAGRPSSSAIMDVQIKAKQR